MQTNVKGRTTIRTAAICFLASAVLELLDLTSPVPLLVSRLMRWITSPIRACSVGSPAPARLT